MDRNRFSRVGLLLSVSIVVTFLGGMQAVAQTEPPAVEWEKTLDAGVANVVTPLPQRRGLRQKSFGQAEVAPSL